MAVPDNTALQAQGVCKGYGKGSQRVEVLKGVHFTALAQQKIAIMGASGAGKSTFLHILGTLDAPDQGEIHYFDQVPPYGDDEKLSRFRNQHIGFVFQFHHLLSEFTAIENVMLPCLIAGESKSTANERARCVLEEVGLETRLHHRPAALSGGEQQRVAIARAVVQKPSILIADEPTGNLDRENGERVFELLMGLNLRFGMTLIMATHNFELAKRMDLCLELSDGKIREK